MTKSNLPWATLLMQSKYSSPFSSYINCAAPRTIFRGDELKKSLQDWLKQQNITNDKNQNKKLLFSIAVVKNDHHSISKHCQSFKFCNFLCIYETNRYRKKIIYIFSGLKNKPMKIHSLNSYKYK